MRKLRLLHIVFLMLSIQATLTFGQSEKIDSLRQVWQNNETPDSTRMKALNEFIWSGYMYSNPDSAIHFARVLNKMAVKNSDPKMAIASTNSVGVAKSLLSDYDSALFYFQECELISRQAGFKVQQGTSFMNIGTIHRNTGNLAEAIINFNKARSIYEAADDMDRVAQIYGNIAIVYLDQKDFDKSLEFLRKGEALMEQGYGDETGRLYNYYNQSVCYLNKEVSDSALYFAEKAQEVAISTNNVVMIGHIYTILGSAYRSIDDGMALEQFEKALKHAEVLGDLQGLAVTNYNIADMLFKQKKYAQAIEYASKGLETSEEIGSLFDMNEAARILYHSHKELGRYKEALDYFEKHIFYRDSLEGEVNQKEILNQEYKFEYEKKAAADSIKVAEERKTKDALLEAERAENQRQKQQSYFLIIGLFIAVIFGVVVFNRFKVTNKQKVIIEEQKEKVDIAYAELDEKNNEIIDSITYAKRIQRAILPPDKIVKEYLNESFILYVPKDIVAGDFYWMEQKNDTILFAAADCTGHGVPGAMVSVICNNGLNRSVREYGILEPGKILDKTREIVIKEFAKSEDEVKDGMDIALCSLRALTDEAYELKYAGAHNPLWVIRNDSKVIEEYKANKQPIGQFSNPEPYKTHSINLEKGDTLYIFSDGFADQFGGDKGKKFKSSNFKELLISVVDKPMEDQRKLLFEAFEDWKGSLEQLDDVCVIGVRL